MIVDATRLFLIVSSLVTIASPAGAQAGPPGAVIRGQVVDHTGRPVSDVVSELIGTEHRAVSDVDGRFIIGGIPVGRHRLVVRHVGFVSQSLNANITGPDTIETRLTLHSAPTILDTVVSVAPVSERMRLNGFEEHRKLGLGRFFTESDLARFPGSLMSTVLRNQVPRALFVLRGRCGGRSIASKVGASIGTRGVIGECLMQDACYFQVFVDGQRIYAYNNRMADPPDIDAFLLNQLAGVEIYQSAAVTPARYSSTGSPCGTIVLWMRR